MTVSLTLLTIGAAFLAYVTLSLGLKAGKSGNPAQASKVTYSSPDPFVGPNRRNG